MTKAAGAARTYYNRYRPNRVKQVTSRENIADALASVAGGVGMAVAGGVLADKVDPRWANAGIAAATGTASVFVERGGWRTFLQGVASASAGQAALAILADTLDDKPDKSAKEAPDRRAPNPPPAAALPSATQASSSEKKRNAVLPSGALDRAFARSESRLAQMLASEPYA